MKTLQQRTVYHALKYEQFRRSNPDRADLHRAASDQRDVAGATYRYRQGVKYATQARGRV